MILKYLVFKIPVFGPEIRWIRIQDTGFYLESVVDVSVVEEPAKKIGTVGIKIQKFIIFYACDPF
jgi:hypothetical protein